MKSRAGVANIFGSREQLGGRPFFPGGRGGGSGSDVSDEGKREPQVKLGSLAPSPLLLCLLPHRGRPVSTRTQGLGRTRPVAESCPTVPSPTACSPHLGTCVCVAKSWSAVATPWSVARQAPLCMGFSRQEYWSGLPLPSPGDLPDPGMEPTSPTRRLGPLSWRDICYGRVRTG